MANVGSWIEWTPDLSIGVEKIDNQHKELIKRFNNLADAVFDGRGKEEIGDILHFLADYTVTHFRDEEALQDLFGYPGFQRHKKIHDQFVSEVQTLIKKFEAEDLDSDLVVKTVDSVGAWVLNHIKKEDMEIGNYLKTKRSAQEQDDAASDAALEQLAEQPTSDFAQNAETPVKKGLFRRIFDWLW